MLDRIIGVCTAERLSALLVYVVGAIVGSYAAKGMSPVQWGGSAMAVIGAILVAVIVRTWPAKKAETAKAESR
ncbi:hypothetical protein [Caulobacter sp. 17J80-11]|uniref:hypothetical protein n=1 Tax=Caulobacter sp. 17J80-11 TaxID=2763502 RepID=UPI001653AF72|nr:hypothetical protein [Caulobacter sp. 17J80-11]MBC6981505.1 hypothetical protein [Caulobacter sp. 17J80-11]